MPRPPRSLRPRVNQPSPLKQVHHTRPVSQAPEEMGLVRDPQFWKRFSTAVHIAEVGGETGSQSPISSDDGKSGNDWLQQQRREKRNCRTLCVSITAVVVVAIVGGVVAAWYFLSYKKGKGKDEP